MGQQRAELDGFAGAAARREPGRRPPARDDARPERGTERGAGRGMPVLAVLFLLSLLPQINFSIGPIMLKPYRVVLLILFVPLLLRLLSGAAGRMMAVDWLMIGASLWAVLALMMNHPIAETIEPIGTTLMEFLGGYMVARVCIRSAEDFRRAVKALFLITLFLLAFAVLESMTHRPVLLQLLGQGWAAVDAGVRMGLRRAQVVFAHPIHYGVFVAAGLGLVWYALRPDAGFAKRAACALVIALSTFFSLSSGALLSFMMQCVFIAWETVMRSHPMRWRIFALGALVLYLAIDIFSTRTPFHVLVTYATFNTDSAYMRILIWDHGTANVRASPLFGIGLNDWERPYWMTSSVDNFWLLLTMQFGVPFIVLFGAALYLMLRRVSRQQLTDPVDRACRAGYLTTFGGVVIAAATVHYWQTMFAFVLFLFGTGMWIISGGAKPEPADPVPQDRGDSPSRRAGPGGEASRRKRSIL